MLRIRDRLRPRSPFRNDAPRPRDRIACLRPRPGNLYVLRPISRDPVRNQVSSLYFQRFQAKVTRPNRVGLCPSENTSCGSRLEDIPASRRKLAAVFQQEHVPQIANALGTGPVVRHVSPILSDQSMLQRLLFPPAIREARHGSEIRGRCGQPNPADRPRDKHAPQTKRCSSRRSRARASRSRRERPPSCTPASARCVPERWDRPCRKRGRERSRAKAPIVPSAAVAAATDRGCCQRWIIASQHGQIVESIRMTDHLCFCCSQEGGAQFVVERLRRSQDPFLDASPRQ